MKKIVLALMCLFMMVSFNVEASAFKINRNRRVTISRNIRPVRTRKANKFIIRNRVKKSVVPGCIDVKK